MVLLSKHFPRVGLNHGFSTHNKYLVQSRDFIIDHCMYRTPWTSLSRCMSKMLFTLVRVFPQPVFKTLNSQSKIRKFSVSHSQTAMDLLEAAKKQAAEAAVVNHVKDGDVVGIGSGSTIIYAVQKLAQRVKEESIAVKCVPTSFQARQLIHVHGLTATSLEEDPILDVTIDGADEADKNLTLIKGGGGCLAQEKVVAEAANTFVVIADYRKKVESLGTSWSYVPIEILPMAYKPVQTKIQAEFGGKVELRSGGKAKAGPVITDNGNFILDWYFDINHLRKMSNFEGNENDAKLWKEVNSKLLHMAGIVDSGLFVSTAKFAYFGMSDGTVQKVIA